MRAHVCECVCVSAYVCNIKRTSRRTAPLKCRNSVAIKASERNRYWNDPAVRLTKRADERKRYRMGHRTTLPPKGMSWHVVLH